MTQNAYIICFSNVQRIVVSAPLSLFSLSHNNANLLHVITIYINSTQLRDFINDESFKCQRAPIEET